MAGGDLLAGIYCCSLQHTSTSNKRGILHLTTGIITTISENITKTQLTMCREKNELRTSFSLRTQRFV